MCSAQKATVKSFQIYDNLGGRTPTKTGYLLIIVAVAATGVAGYLAPRVGLWGSNGNWACALVGLVAFAAGAGVLRVCGVAAWKKQGSGHRKVDGSNGQAMSNE